MDEQRAGRLQALRQHPSWPELEQAVAERVESYVAGLGRILMTTGKLPDDFEYKRGFLAGMQLVCRYPGEAAKSLERAVAKSKTEENA